MDEQAAHIMVLESTQTSGTEEWYCPTCGRRFLLSWPPNYQKIIVNTGDESARHSGRKGGISMGIVKIDKPKVPELPEKIIAALEEILRDFDLDDTAEK